MPGSLTVLVPGLFGPRPSDDEADLARAAELIYAGLELDALARMLSWADRYRDPWCDPALEVALCNSMGVESVDGGQAPIAPITRQFDGGVPDEAWYMRADPVHIRPGLGEMTLFDAGTFSITQSEADALAREINQHFHSETWRLEVLHPQRWYLRCAHEPALSTAPLSLAAGLSVAELMPGGDEAAAWRRLMNEMQMLLHASPVNARRQARSEVAINSLWLWGGGRACDAPQPRWRQVWTDNHLLQALAAHTGTQCASGSAQSLLDSLSEEGESLLMFDQLQAPSDRRDVETWRERIAALTQEWFQPLLACLKHGQIAELTLSLGNTEHGFRIRASWLRRMTRRYKPLQSFARRA